MLIYKYVLFWVLVFPGPWTFAGPGPSDMVPNLYLPALAPNLYLPALAYNFITSPGPEFTYINLVSSICICIYGPGLRFVLPDRGLDLHWPYYW